MLNRLTGRLLRVLFFAVVDFAHRANALQRDQVMVRGGAEGSGETRLETWVSYVLIIGVVISLVLEAAGMILSIGRSHSFAISHGGAVFIRGRDFFYLLRPTAPGNLSWHHRPAPHGPGHCRAHPDALYQGGHVGHLFRRQKELKYCLITFFVLAILTVSLMTH